MSVELQEFYARTAEIIGDVSPKSIERIVEASNKGKHVVHGIKKASSLREIEKKGILPLTPEGGMVSFWVCGTPIFGSTTDSRSPFNFFDTPFFNYGHSLMAITNLEVLKKICPELDIKQNSEVTLNFPVPRENIFLVGVTTKNINSEKLSREQGKEIERKMLNLLEEVLIDNYKVGGSKFVMI